jgi:hypothetical protein
VLGLSREGAKTSFLFSRSNQPASRHQFLGGHHQNAAGAAIAVDMNARPCGGRLIINQLVSAFNSLICKCIASNAQASM